MTKYTVLVSGAEGFTTLTSPWWCLAMVCHQGYLGGLPYGLLSRPNPFPLQGGLHYLGWAPLPPPDEGV